MSEDNEDDDGGIESDEIKVVNLENSFFFVTDDVGAPYNIPR